MAVGATGFRNSSGTDLNGIFWGWSGDGGNRNITDSNGNCGWNCACNACNGNCNCNCGNCDAGDLGFGVTTDRRINIFRNTSVGGAINASTDGIRHDNQDNTMGGFQWYRSNCNCNCACNCNCNCACNC